MKIFIHHMINQEVDLFQNVINLNRVSLKITFSANISGTKKQYCDTVHANPDDSSTYKSGDQTVLNVKYS